MTKPTYEIATVIDQSITVDVSALAASEEMFFNATQMAKPFGKRPNDWLVSVEAKEYIEALLITRNPCKTVTKISGNEELVRTRTGRKYGGTWMHNDLCIAFARWLSPMFAVQLDQWVKKRIRQEFEWQRQRMESKTGFLPMTDAIQLAHDPVKPYHFSNECNMINRIVLGMSAKEFKLKYGTDSVRDHVTEEQINAITLLQQTNTGLINIGMTYQERKKHLNALFENRFLAVAA